MYYRNSMTFNDGEDDYGFFCDLDKTTPSATPCDDDKYSKIKPINVNVNLTPSVNKMDYIQNPYYYYEDSNDYGCCAFGEDDSDTSNEKTKEKIIGMYLRVSFVVTAFVGAVIVISVT
jgi:hypothetical protein